MPSNQNMDNLYMHLTNYAINKDHPNYVFNDNLKNLSYGHKKSLAEFFKTLKAQGHPAHNSYSISIVCDNLIIFKITCASKFYDLTL